MAKIIKVPYYLSHFLKKIPHTGDTRWEEGKMMHRPELVEEDRGTPSDLRKMREFVKLGSSVNPDVQLTGDCPSNHLSGKMPALDTQIWVENGQIRFEHYRKLCQIL